MNQQLFETPALIFDECNGPYEPRLAFLFDNGWAHPSISKRDRVLLHCSDCEKRRLGLGECVHGFKKCVWKDEYAEEVSWMWQDLDRILGPDGVEYGIAFEGGLWLVPPGWAWDDQANWYVPQHCEGCDIYDDCEEDDPGARWQCRCHEGPDEDSCKNCDRSNLCFDIEEDEE